MQRPVSWMRRRSCHNPQLSVYYSEDYTNVEETLTEFRKDLIRSLHNKLHNCGRSEYNTIYEQLENMNNSKIIFTDSTIGQLV